MLEGVLEVIGGAIRAIFPLMLCMCYLAVPVAIAALLWYLLPHGKLRSGVLLGNIAYQDVFLVKDMAERRDQVEEEFIKKVEDRNIPGVKVSHGSLIMALFRGFGPQRQLVFVDYPLGKGINAIAGVRVTPFGESDLVIGYWHFERTTLTALVQLGTRLGMIIAGALTAFYGVTLVGACGLGLCMVPGGIAAMAAGIMPFQGRGLGVGFHDIDSQALVQLINMAIREALTAAGIADDLVQQFQRQAPDMTGRRRQ